MNKLEENDLKNLRIREQSLQMFKNSVSLIIQMAERENNLYLNNLLKEKFKLNPDKEDYFVDPKTGVISLIKKEPLKKEEKKDENN